MLNGAGLVHGGCLCYLIDKCVASVPCGDIVLDPNAPGRARVATSCAAFPLVALGIMQKTNGVGVTQALNVFFHAPASL